MSLVRKDDGFTLLELIVAVVIIGVLAAIAVPVFNGQQGSAKVAAAKSDLTNFRTAMMSYAIANGGSFEGAYVRGDVRPKPGTVDKFGWTTGTPSAALYLEWATANDFCASAVGTNNDDVWWITSKGVATTQWC